MKLDTIVTLLIVLLAAFYLARRVRLWLSGRSRSACGWGGCPQEHACRIEGAQHCSGTSHPHDGT